tara:strand:- start:8278 stop:8388 length:111 start_codon:yes stop_codon:yes gene_type:complete
MATVVAENETAFVFDGAPFMTGRAGLEKQVLELLDE